MANHFQILAVSMIGLILFKGCDKAPKYVKPSVATPLTYKEIAPDTFKETNDWKFARPSDAVIRGKWWEITLADQAANLAPAAVGRVFGDGEQGGA